MVGRSFLPGFLLAAACCCDALVLCPMRTTLMAHACMPAMTHMGLRMGITDECLANLGDHDKDHITDCLAPEYGTPAEEECRPDEECQPSYVNQRLVGWAKASSRQAGAWNTSWMNLLARAFRGFRRPDEAANV